MKFSRKKEEKKTEQEKVDARREEVLAAGRKFKYPLQWTKYRVVVNTILISFVVIGIIFVAGWLALYRFNMTDDMLFRITKILPVPVANVDGKNVRFSDYLMFYRLLVFPDHRGNLICGLYSSIDVVDSHHRHKPRLRA